MGDWIKHGNGYYEEHVTDRFMKELESFYMSLPNDVKQYNKEISAIKGERDSLKDELAQAVKNHKTALEDVDTLQRNVDAYYRHITALKQKPLVRLQAFVDKVVSKIKFPRIAITWK